MGNKQSKQEKSQSPIKPLPGTYGAPVRKRGHITIYTEKEVYYMPYAPSTTISSLKSSLFKVTGKNYSLFANNKRLKNRLTLAECGVPEFGMLKALSKEVDNSSASNNSVRSCPLVSRDTSLSKSLWDMDLSVYAAPEAGTLAKKKPRRSFLRTIKEDFVL